MADILFSVFFEKCYSARADIHIIFWLNFNQVSFPFEVFSSFQM